MDNVYKIKKALQIPMIIATLVSIPVFADVIMRGFKLSMMIMVIVLMILFYLLTLNNILRKVHIKDTGITIRGILGLRRISMQDITLIDGITMGSRQFVSVSAKKKTYLLPNSFERFPDIISDFEKIAPENTLGKGIESLKENIVERKSDITGAWITVILLLIIILIRFFPK